MSIENNDLEFKIRKEKLKEDTDYSLRLNKEFAIYFENQFEKRIFKKVQVDGLKKKANILMLPTLLFSLISIFSNDIHLITRIIQMLFGFGFLYFLALYLINKNKYKKELDFSSHDSMKLNISIDFENSYASKELLQAFKDTFGQEALEEILFENGSDPEKITIKFLNSKIEA